MLDLELEWEKITNKYPFPFPFDLPTQLVYSDSRACVLVEKYLETRILKLDEQAELQEAIIQYQNSRAEADSIEVRIYIDIMFDFLNKLFLRAQRSSLE